MRYRLLGAAFSLTFLAASANAAHPLITEDTGTQGKGRYQLELFGERTRDEAAGLVVRATQVTAVQSYGVVDSVDIQFGIPYLRQSEDDGATRTTVRGRQDAAIDVKWRFYERDGLSLGLKPGVTLPTGDDERGLGSGRAGWGSLLIVSYETGPVALHSHVGYRRNRNTLDERESLGHISGAVMYKVVDSVRLIADLSWDTNPDKASNDPVRYSIIGAIWGVNRDLDLDIGWRRGHGEPATDKAFLLGATFRW